MWKWKIKLKNLWFTCPWVVSWRSPCPWWERRQREIGGCSKWGWWRVGIRICMGHIRRAQWNIPRLHGWNPRVFLVDGIPHRCVRNPVHHIPDNITPVVHQWLWAAKKPLVDHQWHAGANRKVGFATDGPPVDHRTHFSTFSVEIHLGFIRPSEIHKLPAHTDLLQYSNLIKATELGITALYT